MRSEKLRPLDRIEPPRTYNNENKRQQIAGGVAEYLSQGGKIQTLTNKDYRHFKPIMTHAEITELRKTGFRQQGK